LGALGLRYFTLYPKIHSNRFRKEDTVYFVDWDWNYVENFWLGESVGFVGKTRGFFWGIGVKWLRFCSKTQRQIVLGKWFPVHLPGYGVSG
jgi:hypothetical protein